MSDDRSRFELTRRRLLGSVAVTGTAAAGAGAGTFALFQDTESSTGNTINAGTLELTVSDGDPNEEGASGTWTISNAKPGGEPVLADIALKNAGSIEADHVELDVSVDPTESDVNGNDEADEMPESAKGMAEQFEVTKMTYDDGTDILNGSSDTSGLSDANENGIIDIGDLVSGNDGVLDDITPPPAPGGGIEGLTIEFQWANDSKFDTSVSGTNNDYQGDELDITVTMALHQEESQDI